MDSYDRGCCNCNPLIPKRPALMKELMRVAEKISVNKDYSKSAENNQYEFGRLTNIFNEMMDSLDDADQKVHEANNQMENKVKRRTQELSDAISC